MQRAQTQSLPPALKRFLQKCSWKRQLMPLLLCPEIDFLRAGCKWGSLGPSHLLGGDVMKLWELGFPERTVPRELAGRCLMNKEMGAPRVPSIHQYSAL